MRVLLVATAGVALLGLAGFATAASTTPAPAAAAKPVAATTAPATSAAVVVKDAKGVSYTGDAAAGEKTFKQCIVCHSVKAGENKVGPTLFGIVGRPAGTVEKYNYSTANKKSGLTWTEQVMFDYLENPRAKIPGTKMAFVGLKKPQDRANVIAYLKKVGTPPAAPPAKPK
jgi:cytochrome c